VIDRRQALLAIGLVAVLPASGLAQDATAGDERYTVTYLDIMPSARTTFSTALARYREASAAERGFKSLELFEQTGRPGHYVIVETWRDQASVEAHGMAPAATVFRASLESIRTSGYDQRPYKPSSTVSTGRRPPRGAVWVISHVDIGPGGGDAPAMLRRQAEASRRDTGCLRFDVLQHTMRANHFTVIEAWAAQRDYDAHAAAMHSRQYRDELQPVAGSPLDERAFTAVE
jgi:quinol monooxygenase YgiN